MDAQRVNDFDDRVTRARAREARRLRDRERREASDRKVFVVRVPWPDHGFRWEIRRFGSFVLQGSDEAYRTAEAAQAAGEAALAGWPDRRHDTASSGSVSEPVTSVAASEHIAQGRFHLETACPR